MGGSGGVGYYAHPPLCPVLCPMTVWGSCGCCCVGYYVFFPCLFMSVSMTRIVTVLVTDPVIGMVMVLVTGIMAV